MTGLAVALALLAALLPAVGSVALADGAEWVLIGLLVAVTVLATAVLARSSAVATPEPAPV